MRHVTYLGLIFASVFSAGVYADSFFPSIDRWKTSAVNAAKHPATWIPLAGAVVIAATDTDHEISEWASDEKPVFGFRVASNELRDALEIVAYTSLLFSPQQQPLEDSWFKEKATRAAVQYFSKSMANSTVGMLKNQVGRRRPNDQEGLNSHSFPSGHAAEAFAFAALSRRNLDDYTMNDRVRTALNVGIYAMAGGTAWARVEEKGHYPTDVLVGAALGNFIASTIYYAFVGDSNKGNMSIQVGPAEKGVVLNFSLRF